MAMIADLVNIRKHPNADRLRLADVDLGAGPVHTIIVGMEETEGQRGIFFEPDLQISEDFCKWNDLIARYDTDENGKKTKVGGGFFDHTRRVRAQRFRGEKSNGFWMPMQSLMFMFPYPEEFFDNVKNLKPGDDVSTFKRKGDGYEFELSTKYFNEETQAAIEAVKKQRVSLKYFPEHDKTLHLLDHLRDIPAGANIKIMVKYHGTSARFGNVLVSKNDRFTNFVNGLSQKLFKKNLFDPYTHKIVHGSRKIVLTPNTQGYYGDNSFRYMAVGDPKKLPEDFVFYGEIVGYTNTGRMIMNAHKQTEFPELPKTINYTYGCDPKLGPTKFILYRVIHIDRTGKITEMNMATLNALARDYGWYVPHVFADFVYDGDAQALRKKVLDIAEPLGDTYHYAKSVMGDHIEEGVIIMVTEPNGNVTRYKYKSEMFRYLESQARSSGVDMEEVS